MTSRNVTKDVMKELLALCRALGEPARDLAIIAEGNVSAALPGDSLLVKATGTRMATAGPGDLVEVDQRILLELLDEEGVDDQAVARALLGSRLVDTAPRPSVEVLLHVVCRTICDAVFIAHTHPTSVNALLCSDHAAALTAGALFPDQIVVLGRHQLLVPYVDPGLSLARTVRAELLQHVARHGETPKAIYLGNHGMFALGASAAEALAITEMAEKCARVLLGALSVGRVSYMSDADADRIHQRGDEQHRRTQLSLDGG